MRTLAAAAEPPERARDEPTAAVTTGNTAAVVLTWLDASGVTVTPWQTVVIRQAYPPASFKRALS